MWRLLLRAGRSGCCRARAARPPPQQQQQLLQRSLWVDSQGYERFGERPRFAFLRGYSLALLAGAAGAGGTVLYWSCRQEVPYTHRHHAIMLVSQKMELELGQQTFQQVTQSAAANHTLLPPHAAAAHTVRRVGSRIAQVAGDGHGGGYYRHMQGLNWEFAVINSTEVNAFVLPGGKVVVYTGLLHIMSTEDELAAVLAHEVGHVLARHHAERMSQMSVTGMINLVLRLVLGIGIPGPLLMLGLFLPYSRQAEYEADAIGIHLLAKACYDPQANISMLQKLEAQEHKAQGASSSIELLSTHPLTQERVQHVTALLPEAFALYSSSCSGMRGVLERFAGVFG